MTCGIYQLVFSSRHVYIGKSVNIERRWEQHFESFRKGTAAENMQQAYNTYSFPETIILHICHADYLDLMESVAINSYNGTLLNTVYPKPLPPEDVQLLLDHPPLLEYPITQVFRSHLILNETLQELKNTGVKTPKEIYMIEAENKLLLRQREKYQNLNLFQRIFQWPQYRDIEFSRNMIEKLHSEGI